MADTSTAGEFKTTDFGGVLYPNELTLPLLNAALDEGAPVFSSFSRRVISGHSILFASASADGFAWRDELVKLPDVSLHEDHAVVVPHKLGGLLLVSLEALEDASFDLSAELSRQLSTGLAHKADVDLAYGDGSAPNPQGFYAGLTKMTKPSLRSAVISAASAIMAAGGRPDKLLMSPALWAAEAERIETVASHSGGLLGIDGLGLSIEAIATSTLKDTDAVLIDSSQCFGVVRRDVVVESSKETQDAWTRFGVSFRIVARLGVAIPQPARAARALAVGSP